MQSNVPKSKEMSIELRDYQLEAVDAIVSHIKDGKSPVVSMATGSGKSVVLAEVIRKLGGRALVMSHVAEILQQNLDAIREVTGEDVGLYSAGLSRRDIDAPIIVAGVQSAFRNMDKLLDRGKFDYILLDECFPAETLIDGKSIADIRVGDWVSTYNHKEQIIESKKVVSTSVRQSKKLLRISLSSGIIVECTENHPFYTPEGYIDAKELSEGDAVFVRYDARMHMVQTGIEESYKVSNKEIQKNRQDTLLRRMYSSAFQLSLSSRERYPMHLVRDKHTISDTQSKKSLQVKRKGLLFKEMRRGFKKFSAEHYENRKQPDASRGNSKKGQRYSKKNRAQAEDTRRKWSWSIKATGNYATSIGEGMGSRIYCHYEDTKRRKIDLEYMVQDRPSISQREDSDRSRWGESLIFQGSRERQAEGYALSGIRMERIARIEQRNIEGQDSCLVYNLEVEGNHNFFANDILVHNCHMVPPPSNKKSMYSRVIRACEGANRVGLSATPFRLSTGPIWLGDDRWFDCLAYQIGILPLVEMGWLVPLHGIQTASKIDLSKVKVEHGEYKTASLSEQLSDAEVVEKAIDEICELAADRQARLYFCINRDHGIKVADALRRRGRDPSILFGNTHKDERKAIIDGFKSGDIEDVVNVGVMVAGTNVPRIDCICDLAPTLSKGRAVQKIGRGARLSPETGKEYCLVLDLTGSLKEFVPLDGMPALKKSRAVQDEEERQELLAAVERAVKAAKARKLHNPYADREFDPMGNGEVKHVQVGGNMANVRWIDYRVTRSAKRPSLDNLMVTYVLEGSAHNKKIWLCPEYESGSLPRQKAEEWFRRRGIEKIPFDAQACMHLAMRCKDPIRISYKEENGFTVVLSEEFGERKPVAEVV